MDDEKLLLKVPEAARLMGVSTAFGYQAVADGLWPVVRLAGRGVRVPREALIAWVRERTLIPSPAQRTTEAAPNVQSAMAREDSADDAADASD